MAKKRTQPVPRKSRTDAQRDRELILEAAKEAFTRFGTSSSLDDIAKQAGVGAGVRSWLAAERQAPRESIIVNGPGAST